MKTRLELYRAARTANWHWRMSDARNGKIIAASSEGYRRRIDAVRNLDRIVNTGLLIDYRGGKEVDVVIKSTGRIVRP